VPQVSALAEEGRFFKAACGKLQGDVLSLQAQAQSLASAMASNEHTLKQGPLAQGATRAALRPRASLLTLSAQARRTLVLSTSFCRRTMSPRSTWRA